MSVENSRTKIYYARVADFGLTYTDNEQQTLNAPLTEEEFNTVMETLTTDGTVTHEVTYRMVNEIKAANNAYVAGEVTAELSYTQTAFKTRCTLELAEHNLLNLLHEVAHIVAQQLVNNNTITMRQEAAGNYHGRYFHAELAKLYKRYIN